LTTLAARRLHRIFQEHLIYPTWHHSAAQEHTGLLVFHGQLAWRMLSLNRSRQGDPMRLFKRSVCCDSFRSSRRALCVDHHIILEYSSFVLRLYPFQSSFLQKDPPTLRTRSRYIQTRLSASSTWTSFLFQSRARGSSIPLI
jgi:hypothetical protein